LVAHGYYDSSVQPARIDLKSDQYVRFYSGPGGALDGETADTVADLIQKDPEDISWHSKLKGRHLFTQGYDNQYTFTQSSLKRRANQTKVDQDAGHYPKTYNPSRGYLNLLIGPTSNKQVRNYSYSLDKDEEDLPAFTPRFVMLERQVMRVAVQSMPSNSYKEEGTLQQLLASCAWMARQKPFMLHWVACTETEDEADKYLNYIWELK
jgi:hypothetical protein